MEYMTDEPRILWKIARTQEAVRELADMIAALK